MNSTTQDSAARATRAPLHQRVMTNAFELFFGKVSPIDLSVCRLVLFGFLFWRYHTQDYAWEVYRRTLYNPIGMYQWIPLFPAEVIEIMLLVAKVCMVFALVGLFYTPAAIGVALTVPYLIGIGNNFGKVNHSENLLAITLVVFAFARAADSLSIDAWLRRRKQRPIPSPSGEYKWPIRTVWLIIAGMYFSAGISKLLHSGWEWAFSDSFRLLLLRHHFTHSPPTQIGVWLANYPVACQWLAFVSLMLELLCPLLLLGGRYTLIFGGSLMAMQFGIYVLMGVMFKQMIPVFLILVPWEYLWQAVSGPARRMATLLRRLVPVD